VNPYIDEKFAKALTAGSAPPDFQPGGASEPRRAFSSHITNHWFEFAPVNGKLPYDILLEECDPKLVKMEMDLCWIEVGGQDPLKYFKKYPGRFPWFT